MTLGELERLIGDAEANPELREALRLCRSQAELLLAARTRGYHITRVDLLRAWQDHTHQVLGTASGG